LEPTLEEESATTNSTSPKKMEALSRSPSMGFRSILL
jgi:hypothetical protein